MFLYFLMASLLVAFAGIAYDTYMTRKGIVAGVAIEKNQWLVGSKPSTKAFLLRAGLQLSIAVAPSIVFFFLGYRFAALGALAGPAAYGVKSYFGGRTWKKFGV